MPESNISYKFTAQDKFTRVAAKIEKSLKKQGRAFDRLDRKMAKSSRRAVRTSKTMGTAFTKISRLAGGAIGAAAALRVGGAGVNKAAELQKLTARVLQNIRDPEKRKELEGTFRKTIVEQSARSGLSREEIGAGLFDQVSARGAGAKSMQDFIDAVDGAVAATTNLSTVVKGSAKVQENFGDEFSTKDIVAAGIAAQAFGITDLEAIFAALPGASGTAKFFGLDPFELIGLFSAASKRLGSTSEGATAITDILNTLGTATPGSSQFNAIAGLGLPVMEQLKAQPIEQTLRQIEAAAKENPLLFNQAFTSIPAQQLSRSLGQGFFNTTGAVAEAVRFDVANPELSATRVNFETATSGLVGALIDNSAVLEKTSTLIGENLTDTIIAEGQAASIAQLRFATQGGGLIGDQDRPGLLGNIAGANLEGIVAAIFGKQKELAAFRSAETERLLKIEVGVASTDGLSTTVGVNDSGLATGDQTAVRE